MSLKYRKELFILVIAFWISLVLDRVNGAESGESNENNEAFKLLASLMKKSGYSSYESGERRGNSVNKLSDYISDLVEDKLRRKLGKVGGRRGGRFMDDSDERDERRERSNRRKEENYKNYKENKDYRKSYEPKKYEYNDYANKPEYNAPIYREEYPASRYEENNRKYTVPISNYFNQIYYINVTVGYPPKKFSLLISTALSSMWIPAVLNTGNKTNTFNPNDSKSARCKNVTWNLSGILAPHTIGGADKSAGLVTCEDTVQFNGIALYKQTFGLAKDLDALFLSYIQLDGFFGLGFPSTNIFNGDSVLTSIQKQAYLDKNIFSIWLNLNHLNTKRGGEITFGGVNSNLFYGSLYYVPLSTPYKAWNIKVESFSVNSTVLATNFDALVDAGDSCIAFPSNVLSQVASISKLNLTDNDNVFIPCNMTSSLPSLTYTINTSNYGRYAFTVDPSSYVQPSTSHIGECFVCLDLNNKDVWVLGTPFITKFYTVFDSEKQRVGFAKAVKI